MAFREMVGMAGLDGHRPETGNRVYDVYNGPAMNSRELIRMLEEDGWKLVAVKGSHHQFKHPGKSGRVTVPHPKKDLPLGTVRGVLKQAGLR